MYRIIGVDSILVKPYGSVCIQFNKCCMNYAFVKMLTVVMWQNYNHYSVINIMSQNDSHYDMINIMCQNYSHSNMMLEVYNMMCKDN